MASVAGACAAIMTTAVPMVMRLLEDNATATMFASDWRVAAFTMAGVVVTCLLVSLAPALQTTRIVWRGATATMTARTGHMRGVVLAAQIAIAAVLVLSATLLARGIGHAVSAPTDFALHTTTAVTFERACEQEASTAGARTSFGRRSRRLLKNSNLPIGIASTVPAAADQTSVRPAHSEIEYRCKVLPLTASAFAVLDLKIASGRFASDDPAAAEAVINETLARQIWPTESALGKTLTVSRNRQSVHDRRHRKGCASRRRPAKSSPSCTSPPMRGCRCFSRGRRRGSSAQSRRLSGRLTRSSTWTSCR